MPFAHFDIFQCCMLIQPGFNQGVGINLRSEFEVFNPGGGCQKVIKCVVTFLNQQLYSGVLDHMCLIEDTLCVQMLCSSTDSVLHPAI